MRVSFRVPGFAAIFAILMLSAALRAAPPTGDIVLEDPAPFKSRKHDIVVEPLPDVLPEPAAAPAADEEESTAGITLPDVIARYGSSGKSQSRKQEGSGKTVSVKPSAPVVREEPADEAAAPAISSAPVIMGGADTVRGAPVAHDLRRYQFMPLPAGNADSTAMPLLWPVLASRTLGGDSHGLVQRAVILVHDDHRNAEETLRQAQILAGPGASGRLASTMIIAPLFPIAADRDRFKPLLTDATQHVAVWSAADWWQGGETPESENGNRRASSMTAMDLLLMVLADDKNFPELRQIVVAGYGRGADFVHRYALFGRAQDLLAEGRPRPRYVLFAPQSHVYLTDNRPTGGQGGFAAPKEVKDCPQWQAYPYGLEQPNAYARLTAGNVARQNYAQRDIATLVGGDDIGAAADTDCAARLHGKSVKERAENYDAFLKNSFGELPRQKLLIMPGVGDDPMALVTSGCGASLLFADGSCLRAR